LTDTTALLERRNAALADVARAIVATLDRS
jgi:hypothetical protein